MCQQITVINEADEVAAELGTLGQLRAFLGAGEIVRYPGIMADPATAKDNHCLCGVDKHATAKANGYETSEEYPGSHFMEWRRLR